MSNRIRLMARSAACLVLLTMIGAAPAAVDKGARSRVANRLVVHEWGTFTSVAGSDGVAVEWRPLGDTSDLPGFVYSLGTLAKGTGLRNTRICVKCNYSAIVRMETPVIYFYSNRPMTASVRVDFRGGKITEWYPHARFVYQSKEEPYGVVDWGLVRIQPGTESNFPVEAAESHYYAARETDAAPIRVCGDKGEQREKFLFYRGLGTFGVPLSAKVDGDHVILANNGDQDISQVILFENRGGHVGFTIHDVSGGPVELSRPETNQTIESLERELEFILVAHGLYEKEARAMIKTWRDSWFEEGLRAFYVVPRKTVESVLSLQIEPAPSELVRVLVGRVEVITPETENPVRLKIAGATGSPTELRRIAREIAAEHGRFAEPILKGILAKPGDPWLKDRVQQVINISRFWRASGR